MVIVRLLPASVLIEVPFSRRELYATVPWTTVTWACQYAESLIIISKSRCIPWYCKMLAKAFVDRLAVALPMTLNASLLGTNTVTSFNSSNVETRFAFVSAPAAAVRFAATAVVEMLVGMVRTELTM